MSGYGRGRGRISSLQAFDANEPAGGGRYGGRGGGRGRGRGRRPLNANLNYLTRGGEGGGSEEDSSHKVRRTRSVHIVKQGSPFPFAGLRVLNHVGCLPISACPSQIRRCPGRTAGIFAFYHGR